MTEAHMGLGDDILAASNLTKHVIRICVVAPMTAIMALASFNLLREKHWAYGSVSLAFVCLLVVRARQEIRGLRQAWKYRSGDGGVTGS